MQNVIIYTRVSTEEQADKGYSLRDQQDRLEKYCDMKSYNIIRHYQEDHSAKSFDRPEFKKLMEFAKQSKNSVNKIIVVKWDRFSRNVTDALMMLRTFSKMNIEVHSAEQPIDINIPEQKMMLSFYLTAPEVENDRRAMNTTMGMRRAMKEGRWVNNAPFGYINSRDAAQKPILLLTDKAPLVKEAFELYATNLFDKEEVRKKLKKKGMTLQRAAFWRIFHNPVYYGKILIKAYRDESEQIVPGLHPPIISEELFIKVQLVAQGKKLIKAKVKRQSAAFPLRGLLACSICGKNLTGSASKGNGGQYEYYHCQSGCKERHRSDIAHNCFSEWLESIRIKPEIASFYLTMMEDIFKEQEGDKVKEIKKLEEQVQQKRELLEKATRKFVSDEIDRNDYKAVKELLEKELFILTEQISELKNTETGFMEYARYNFYLLSNLNAHFQEADVDTKQKLLGLIFPEKLIFSKGEYRTKKPSEVFTLLSNAGKGFGGFEKGKTSKNRSLSGQVARTRIELVFPP